MADASLEDRIRQVIDHDVSPHVRAHLGDVAFDRLDDQGVVHVTFSGACEACSYRKLTLLGAVLPRVVEIEGVSGVAAPGVPISPNEQRRVVAVLGPKRSDVSSAGVPAA